ncbi:MAG: hypothetical protein IJW82_00605 [Clostridia bacterium]|nr:hypothetical protein [Clostridia bacterium]
MKKNKIILSLLLFSFLISLTAGTLLVSQKKVNAETNFEIQRETTYENFLVDDTKLNQIIIDDQNIDN